VLGYTVPPPELRDAIVARMRRLYGWSIEPGWIVFLPGVVPGLHLAARKLLPADGHALLPKPLYQHFKRALELAPRAYTEVPLVLQNGRWVLNLNLLKQSITSKSRLVYLCNPQNPGGTVFRRDELIALAEATRDFVIVSDEIHCDLILDRDKRHVPIASIAPEVSRRTVTLGAATKAFNFPGAGCAWAIIENESLRREFSSEVTAHVLHSPSVFGYVATLAAYRGGDEWLAAQLNYLRENRDLVECATGLPMAHVEATYLAWIDCASLNVPSPYEFFLKSGVALSPGAQFGDPRYVRLNFGTQKSRLREALTRMSGAISTIGMGSARPPGK
jgi:bifunctional pyridoxal-dependent enzyme with beta-cystathionase and maltose regulon repressor activities